MNSDEFVGGITHAGLFGTIGIVVLLAIAIWFYTNTKFKLKKEVKNGRTKD